ncbi:MAG: catecholate siderophore receptor [Rhodospirillaceae bacterium]|jgi:catecholate siderophore receptor|nr:catecholate siderophore receptor [Rhodospirillaceae bacterium]
MARRIPVKTALVGLLFSPGAMAQQTPDQNAQAPDPTPPPNENKPADPTAAPATMQPVTVTGSRPSEDFQTTKTSINRLGAADLMDVPQSVVVINKALMESQGATSLQSAIRNVPGITIGAAEGGTIGNNFNINGFSARTDLYLDGMRDRGQYYRDVFALEQIEVLFGPASLLFGRGSTGGVINQVTKKPGLKNATELSASVTTNGLVRTTADVNVPFGQDSSNAARVNAMFQYGKASTVDMTTVQDFGFAPAVKFGIGTPTQITLQALMQHNHDQVPYGVPPLNGFPLNVPRNTAYGFSDDYTNQDAISLMATVDHAFNKNFKLRNQTMFNFVNTNVHETSGNAVGTLAANGGFVPAANGAIATPFSGAPLSQLYVRQQSRDRNIYDFTLDNQTELSANFDTGPVGHTFLLGAEFAYESYWNQSFYRNGTCNGVPLQASNATTGFVGCTPAGGTTWINSPSNIPDQYGNLASAQAWTAAGYFNDTIQVMPWLKLVGGLRLDYYYAQIGNSQNSANIFGNTTVPYFVQPITFLSVRTGAIVEPTRQQSYYFSYSTSFNPSLEQLTSTTGSAQLPPEQNEAFEAGAKFELLNGNLSLNAALFQITKTNARTQNPDGTFSATGTVRVKGVRTGVTGRITPEWQIFGGYAYLDGRIIDGVGAGTQGMVPLNTPRDSGTVWSTYTFRETYEIGGGATYIGYRYANNTNTVQVPDFVRLDMTAAYRQPTYDVRLNIFNLTNTMYYEQVIASDGGRAVAGSGLTAMLTYTHRL